MLRSLSISGLSVVCAVLCAAAVGCGGSTQSTNPVCTGGPYDVVGDWTLDVSGGGGASSGPGVVDSSGNAVFFQTSTTTPALGDTVTMPSITGTCSFSGTAIAYGTPISGGGSATDAVTGKVNSSTSINGTLSNGNSFTLTPGTPLSGPVIVPPDEMYAQVQGAESLDEFDMGFGGSTTSMSVTGNNNTGCIASGTFAQAGAGNVFDVSITFSGTTCPPAGITGVGFESTTDYFGFSGNPQLTGTYLYAVSSNSATVMEFYPAPTPSQAAAHRRP